MRHRTRVAVMLAIVVLVAVAVLFVVLASDECPCLLGGGGTVTGAPSLPQYSVTFHEVGLNPGVRWGVNFSGSRESTSGTSLKFILQGLPGTYTYEVTGAAGYTATPASGTLGLYQSDVSSLISFEHGTGPTYTVLLNVSSPGAEDLGPFSQVLYLNLSDGASFSSVDGANITFSAPNGDYSFSAHSSDPQWVADPRVGNIRINGAFQVFPIELRAFTFNLTFIEAGLPTDTPWNLTVAPSIAGGNLSGSSGSFSTARWNGSFDFSVHAPDGYTASPSQGTAWVHGSDLNVTIEFSLPSNPVYPIIFGESGLSNRTGWAVTLDGDTQWAPSGFTITFYGPFATYSFAIASIPGYNSPGTYAAIPAAGDLNVTSGAVVEQIYFYLD